MRPLFLSTKPSYIKGAGLDIRKTPNYNGITVQPSQVFSSLHHILVCEDHHLVQLGLQISLQKSLPHLKTLHLAGTAAEALQFAKAQKPDLALIDLGLPDMPGVQLIQQLQNLWPAVKVLVITSCNNPSILFQVKKLRVAGIMQKASSSEELKTALL